MAQQNLDLQTSTSSSSFLSVSRLVHLCTLSFDGDGELIDASFPHALFLVHQWWIPFSELMAQFISLYQEVNKDKKQFEPRLKYRICYAVGYWIRHFPMHFDANHQLCRLVQRLRNLAEKDKRDGDGDGEEEEEGSVDEMAIAQLDVSSIPSYAWLRNVSIRNPAHRQISLSFDQWNPEEIAASLTHIDHKLLCRITFAEYKRYACTSNLGQTPILERSISVFNSLSNWVQCMVLSKIGAKERAEMMTKFVNNLRQLSNFNTLMAVIGGVSHSSIGRLSKTLALLDPVTQSELNNLTQLLSNNANFAQYRRALQETGTTFRIPIIGVHLKDLTLLNSAMADFDDRGQLINCKKLSQLASIFSNLIVKLDRTHSLPEASLDLINTLKVSLDIHYNEDDIYQLSLKREPRTLLNFDSSTPKPIVFADWAAGVCSAPDPDTVNKHVNAMVDSMFKHYDQDRDGYISQAEFCQIVGNFPFIDPFATIDVDKDGEISKSEMKAYFIRVNLQSSMEFRRGFKHNFRECTFLTPTTCQHCQKVLWGLIRQGFKCKDCGVPVHGACKDSAVLECTSRKPSWMLGARENGNAINPRRRLFLNISTSLIQPVLQFDWFNGGAQFLERGVSLRRSKPSNRLRTVSNTSTPSPEPRAECSATASSHARSTMLNKMSMRLSNSSSSSKHKTRARSETVDCYRCTSPECDIVPSLACEEVFEDESASMNNDGEHSESRQQQPG